MKIICTKGEGREINPFDEYLDFVNNGIDQSNPKWLTFQYSVQTLPVYDQSGNLFLGEGEFEADHIYQQSTFTNGWEEITKNQHKWHYKNHSELNQPVHKVRQIYRLTDPIQPTDKEKEETKTSKNYDLIDRGKVIELIIECQKGNQVFGELLFKINRL